MTADDLAARCPRLFHLTSPDAIHAIRRHGLLSTAALLDLFMVSGPDREAIELRRRPALVTLRDPRHGEAVLTDNLPLSEAALARCLDDGLQPADWLRLLNGRVFFFADEGGLQRLLGARINRERARDVLVVDTLGLARAHGGRMDVSTINTGATVRRAARRGLSTFRPLAAHPRTAPFLEISVRGGIEDIADHLLELRRHRPRSAILDLSTSSP